MKKKLTIFVICSICLFIFSAVIDAKFQRLSSYSTLNVLESMGYHQEDILEAEGLARKFNLSVRTILKLRPDGYEWELVEIALDEMQKTKIKLNDPQKRKEDTIISALSKDFTDDEIMLVAYYGKIFDKNIEDSLSEIIEEKKTLIDGSVNNPLTDIDLSTIECEQMTLSSSNAFEKSYDIDQSSPFSMLMESSTDTINPFTGSLKVFNQGLVLPGKNGLDLDLSLVFRSDGALLDRIYICQASFRSKTSPSNQLFTRFNLGVGWSFSFPFLGKEDEHPSMYLHFNNQSYLIDWDNTVSGLKDVNTKENVLSKYNSLSFPDAKYLLKTKKGINYYFNAAGDLIQMKNRYGDEINFVWKNYRLDKIIDSINRVITFSYFDTFVIMTLNSGSEPYQVKFHKEHVNSYFYKLSRIEYPEGVSINYDYTLAISNFCFYQHC